MKKLPKIETVRRYCSIACEGDKAYITYHINDRLPSKCSITAVVPRYHRPKRSDEIVDQNEKFVNGYKVVVTENGEYAYVREIDNTLLPYRYDVAFDFNKHGFAIVGKDGDVSWINTEFKYLNRKGQMVEEELDNEYAKFKGWSEVRPFSVGTVPLARLYDGRDNFGAHVSYLNTKGELQKFYVYDGKLSKKNYCDDFVDDWDDKTLATFDKKGIAYTKDGILFAEGIYLSKNSLVQIVFDSGFMNNIREEANKCFEQEKGAPRTRKQ